MTAQQNDRAHTQPEAQASSYSAPWLEKPRAVRVLLVEDEPDTLATTAWFLMCEAFQVTVAHDGLEALERLRTAVPDIIVTDQLMPGLDGTSLCARLRARPETRHVPIIMYSAYEPEPSSKLYDRMLTKPAGLDELVHEIRALIPGE